jgi:hypothetical protein
MIYSGGGVWTNGDDDVNVVGGKFSDGTWCYTVVDGIITTKASCGYDLTVYAFVWRYSLRHKRCTNRGHIQRDQFHLRLRIHYNRVTNRGCC